MLHYTRMGYAHFSPGLTMSDSSSRSPITLTVSGMSCGHCVRAVDAALAAAPGVASRRVAVGSAEVSLAPGATAASAVAAIRDAGYEAHLVGGSATPGTR